MRPRKHPLIPAQAGIQYGGSILIWTPAFAGVSGD
jgi:hypothetical protein